MNNDTKDIKINICLISYARLGDTVCKLPALKTLKNAFPKSYIRLVSQHEKSGSFITAKDVLTGLDLIDSFELIKITGSRFFRWVDRLFLVARMRRINWDVGIALVPSYPPADLNLFNTFKRYLSYFGCKKIFTPEKIIPFGKLNGRLLQLPHVADNMLQTLEKLGIAIPPPQMGDFLMPERLEESIWAKKFFAGILDPQIKYFAAISLGANMKSNIWPASRYAAVLTYLWEKHRVAPIFFGPSDLKIQCGQTIGALPVKFFCAGEPIGRVAELMRKCSFYLGNDTGLMHLAVATGLKCIMISGARNSPGMWGPYGNGHLVLRKNVECEGCLLEECLERKNQCLMEINICEVVSASEKMILSL